MRGSVWSAKTDFVSKLSGSTLAVSFWKEIAKLWRRIMRVLFVVLCVIASVASAFGGPIYVRPLDKYEVFLYYSETGETGHQVKAKFKADLVFPAGYFNSLPMRKDGKGRVRNGYRTKKDPYIPVDFLYLEGKPLHSYRTKLGRPIIWFKGQEIAIVQKYDDLKDLLCPQSTAFAANHRLTYPTDPYHRPYLGVTQVKRGEKLVDTLILGAVYGTERHANIAIAAIKRQKGFSRHAWLDGGASFLMTEPKPLHLVVRLRLA
jgi:hypothetical protein